MACVRDGVQAGTVPSRRDGLLAQRSDCYRFFVVVGLVFVASLMGTIALCRSMSAMPDMPMPGGWSLAAFWMPTSACGETEIGRASTFVGIWTVMMIPMMLPSLAPALWIHWKTALSARGRGQAARLTLSVGIGYFLAWSLLGALAFAVGTTVAATLFRSAGLARSIPACSSIVVALTGCVQFTSWKAGRIACCRPRPGTTLASTHSAAAACAYGFRLAILGGSCCANLMAALFVVGLMTPWAMLAVTAAMASEQHTPAAGRAVKLIGSLLLALGLFLMARAVHPL